LKLLDAAGEGEDAEDEHLGSSVDLLFEMLNASDESSPAGGPARHTTDSSGAGAGTSASGCASVSPEQWQYISQQCRAQLGADGLLSSLHATSSSSSAAPSGSAAQDAAPHPSASVCALSDTSAYFAKPRAMQQAFREALPDFVRELNCWVRWLPQSAEYVVHVRESPGDAGSASAGPAAGVGASSGAAAAGASRNARSAGAAKAGGPARGAGGAVRAAASGAAGASSSGGAASASSSAEGRGAGDAPARRLHESHVQVTKVEQGLEWDIERLRSVSIQKGASAVQAVRDTIVREEAADAASEASEARDGGHLATAAAADARAAKCNRIVAALQDAAQLQLVCMYGINADGSPADGTAGGRRKQRLGGSA